MKKFMNKITQLMWRNGDEGVVLASENNAKFNVMLGKTIIGTLAYDDNTWSFCYSNEFKEQESIQPLANFPNKNKDYKTSNLWPFFSSRIPSSTQLQIKPEEQEDLVTLLKKFGKKTVANPFELIAL